MTSMMKIRWKMVVVGLILIVLATACMALVVMLLANAGILSRT